MFKNKNINLLFYIIIVIILFLGIGTIVLNNVIFSNKNDDEDYKTDEDISTPYVTTVGLPDGDIDINNDIVQELFTYFREDYNCMYNYVNNISGTNKTKLLIAYNYLIDKNGEVNDCGQYSNLVINDRYYCSNSVEINYNLYNLGINSNEFINYLKSNKTVVLDGGLLDDEMNKIFGNGVGYMKEDFLYSNDSYIHYDSNTNNYIMYKYFNNNGACNNYEEELVSASSSNGKLDIRSKLMDNGNVIRNISRVFKFEESTGNYIFENRYVL